MVTAIWLSLATDRRRQLSGDSPSFVLNGCKACNAQGRLRDLAPSTLGRRPIAAHHDPTVCGQFSTSIVIHKAKPDSESVPVDNFCGRMTSVQATESSMPYGNAEIRRWAAYPCMVAALL